jgi:hypothetical protein
MKLQSRFDRKGSLLLGALSGSLLVSLPMIPLAASAQSRSILNPCPRIYYEEPFNSTRIVPEGCPPNEATRLLELPRGTSTTEVIQPPLPSSRSNPIANLKLTDGKVDVRLKNDTNIPLYYTAIQHTQRRVLPAGEETVLQSLPTPVTITVTRPDGWLLEVMPMDTPQPGLLAITLDETTNFDNNLGALRIQADGQVFLN